MRPWPTEAGFALGLLAFDEHNLINGNAQPPQHRLRLVRPDLRFEDGEFDGWPDKCVFHPVIENRILRNLTIGASLFGQVVINAVALNARHTRDFHRFDRTQ